MSQRLSQKTGNTLQIPSFALEFCLHRLQFHFSFFGRIFTHVAIIKRELRIERSVYEILQILSVTPFEKTPIISVLEQNQVTKNDLEVAKHRFLWD